MSSTEPGLGTSGDIFSVLRQRCTLHHLTILFAGRQSLRQAAADRDVLRSRSLSTELAVIHHLFRRSSTLLGGDRGDCGCQLRARFDEATNIDLATRLQAVGANVVYGVVGYKAHAKMLMVAS